MWFRVTDQPLFAVAGFWQPLKGGARGFAVVTCDPNELVAPVHPKAMITILTLDDHERWLTGGYDEVVALQRPYPFERMTMRGLDFPTRRRASYLTGSSGPARSRWSNSMGQVRAITSPSTLRSRPRLALTRVCGPSWPSPTAPSISPTTRALGGLGAWRGLQHGPVALRRPHDLAAYAAAEVIVTGLGLPAGQRN